MNLAEKNIVVEKLKRMGINGFVFKSSSPHHKSSSNHLTYRIAIKANDKLKTFSDFKNMVHFTDDKQLKKMALICPFSDNDNVTKRDWEKHDIAYLIC